MLLLLAALLLDLLDVELLLELEDGVIARDVTHAVDDALLYVFK